MRGESSSWSDLYFALDRRLPVVAEGQEQADHIREWTGRNGSPEWFLSEFNDSMLSKPLKYLTPNEIRTHGETLQIFADAPRYFRQGFPCDDDLPDEEIPCGSFIGIERHFQGFYVCLAHVPLDVALRTLHELYFERLGSLPGAEALPAEIDRLREASRPTGALGEVRSPQELFDAASAATEDSFSVVLGTRSPGLSLAVQGHPDALLRSAERARLWAITLPMWTSALAGLSLPVSHSHEWYYQINAALWREWEASGRSWSLNRGCP